MPVPLAVLDLASVGRGEIARESLDGSVLLAQAAEPGATRGSGTPSSGSSTIRHKLSISLAYSSTSSSER